MIVCQHCGNQERRSPSDFGSSYKCPSCNEETPNPDYLMSYDPVLKVQRQLAQSMRNVFSLFYGKRNK